jgi:hypothetical protein
MAKVIPVGSELHSKIKTHLMALVKVSDDKLTERVTMWQISEQMNQSYIPAADAERVAKQQKQTWMGSFTNITIPYCYGVQMAMHTYLASVFLSRSPIFQSLGRNGQGQDSMLQVDALLDYQVVGGDMLTPYYLWLNDVLQYGVGILGIYWEKEVQSITAYGNRPLMVNGVAVLDGNGVPETEEFEEVKETPGYEGHKNFNVRPTEFMMDTRVSYNLFQTGEFCGRRRRMSVQELLSKEGRGYFNTKEAADLVGSKDSDLAGDTSGLIETADATVYGSKKVSGMVNLKEMYVKVIPNDMGLGSNRNIEIWRFTLADNNVLIEARPAGWLHGMFPYVVQTMEYDAYGLSSRGVPHIGMPLNQTMDWLLNSHMYNVQKAVNNEFIFDPTMISTRDFLDPQPGKRIRLLPNGYGRDIRSMVHQFSQVDYTRQNISDIAFMEGIFQRIFGTTPQMMGAQQAGGRRSATEIRSTQAGGVSRLKVMSEFMSAASFTPMFRMLLSGSRQMYSGEMQFKIAGSQTAGASQLSMDPSSIAGEFDFVPVDGTLPIDRFAMAAMYKEILMGAAQLPQVSGRYDLAGIFAWTAQMSGIKNLDTFKITPQNEQTILDEARRGNLVNTREVMDGRGTSGGTEDGSQGVAGTPSIPGLGPLG